MRYSIVLASIAASACATSYINVEVGNELNEINEITETIGRYHHDDNNNRNRRDGDREDRHRGDNNRGDNRRDDRNRERRGDRDSEDERSWFGFSRNGRSDRYGRDERSSHNDRYEREGRYGRDGRYEDRYGRCNRRDQSHRRFGRNDFNDYDRQFEVLSIVDDIFGGGYSNTNKNFECITEALRERDEEDAARRCCRQIGGRLFDSGSRCEVRDRQNPEKEWRDCTLRQQGIVRADCLVERRNGNNERQNNQHRRESEQERRREQERRERDQESRRHYVSLNSENDNNNNNGHLQQCTVIPETVQYNNAIRECCEEKKVQGQPIFNGEACIVHRNDAAQEFRQCVSNKARIPEQRVQCQRINVDSN